MDPCCCLISSMIRRVVETLSTLLALREGNHWLPDYCFHNGSLMRREFPCHLEIIIWILTFIVSWISLFPWYSRDLQFKHALACDVMFRLMVNGPVKFVLIFECSFVVGHARLHIMIHQNLHKSRVSCQKGPTRHAYAWQIGPFWQDTLDIQ